jgi:hypothetical protein
MPAGHDDEDVDDATVVAEERFRRSIVLVGTIVSSTVVGVPAKRSNNDDEKIDDF